MYEIQVSEFLISQVILRCRLGENHSLQSRFSYISANTYSTLRQDTLLALLTAYKYETSVKQYIKYLAF